MNIYLNLQDYQAKILFEEIDGIKSYMKVKLKLLEYLLTFWNGNKQIVKPYVCIDVENLHRAFLVNAYAHKIVSFAFDFSIKPSIPDFNDEGNSIKAFYLKGKNCKITEKEISESQTLLNLYNSREDNLYCYSATDNDEPIGDNSKMLFENLLFEEPGYIRFDHDGIVANSQKHPTNHFDVNYSKNVHYKLGLDHLISKQEILQLLDDNLSCVGLDFKAKFTLLEKKNTKSKNKKKKNRYKHKK